MWTAERFIASSQRARRRGVHVAIAVTIGVTAAIALSLIAGSRRSSSVVERFFASAPRYDVRVGSQSDTFQPEAVSALPGVVIAQPTPYMSFRLRDRPHTGDINSSIADFGLHNPMVRVLDGHVPDGHDPFQVVVNEPFVRQFGLGVGDRVPVVTYATDQYDETSRGIYEPHGPTYDFTIAAVVRLPDDIAVDEARAPRQTAVSTDNAMILPNSFWFEHRHEFIDFGLRFDVRLRDGAAGIDAFLAEARQLAGPDQQLLSEPWGVNDRQAAFSAPVDLESGALLGVGIGALVGAAGIALLLIRLEQRGLNDENRALRSMGITGPRLAATAVLRMLPSAAAAAVIAAGGAVALSPRFPIGFGRQLDLHPGVDVNVAVVGVGAVLVVIAPLAIAAAMGWRGSARVRRWSTRRTALWSSSRVPMSVALGGHLAFGAGDRRRRLSSLIGVVAVVIASAAGIAVGAWLGGTQRLYTNPASRGWVWDAAIGNVNFPLDPAAAESITHDPRVRAATLAAYGQATLNDVSTEVLAFDRHGNAPPSIVRGRLPASPTEAALGAGLLKRLGLHIGDTVTLSLAQSEFIDDTSTPTQVTLTIVGQSVSPVFGESDLADVGLVALDAIQLGGGDASPRLALVDVTGPDRAATLSALIADHTEEANTDVIPSRVVNLHRVRAVPIAGLVLALGLALVALITTVVSSRRANRYAVVVLQALGLDGRGERRVVSWQGLTTAGVTLLAAVPLGLLVDATWWRRQRADLGVRAPLPTVPALLVTLAALIIVTAVAASFVAHRRSGDDTLAAALRTE